MVTERGKGRKRSNAAGMGRGRKNETTVGGEEQKGVGSSREKD